MLSPAISMVSVETLKVKLLPQDVELDGASMTCSGLPLQSRPTHYLFGHARSRKPKANLLFLISDCWYGSCVRHTHFGSAQGGNSDGSPHIPTRRHRSLAWSRVRGVLRPGTDSMAIAEHHDR